jgi:hypothetical protein
VRVHNKTTTKQIKAMMCQTIPNLSPRHLAIATIRQGANRSLHPTILADSIEARDFDLTFRNTLFVLFRLRGGGKGGGSEVAPGIEDTTHTCTDLLEAVGLDEEEIEIEESKPTTMIANITLDPTLRRKQRQQTSPTIHWLGDTDVLVKGPTDLVIMCINATGKMIPTNLNGKIKPDNRLDPAIKLIDDRTADIIVVTDAQLTTAGTQNVRTYLRTIASRCSVPPQKMSPKWNT